VVYRTVKGWQYGIEGRASHGAGHGLCSDGFYAALQPLVGKRDPLKVLPSCCGLDAQRCQAGRRRGDGVLPVGRAAGLAQGGRGAARDDALPRRAAPGLTRAAGEAGAQAARQGARLEAVFEIAERDGGAQIPEPLRLAPAR